MEGSELNNFNSAYLVGDRIYGGLCRQFRAEAVLGVVNIPKTDFYLLNLY